MRDSGVLGRARLRAKESGARRVGCWRRPRNEQKKMHELLDFSVRPDVTSISEGGSVFFACCPPEKVLEH